MNILLIKYIDTIILCLFYKLQSPPDWAEILNHFRGSELQNYFTKILEDDLKALIKPQYVDQSPEAVKGTVQALLDRKDEKQNQDEICVLLGKYAQNHQNLKYFHRTSFDGKPLLIDLTDASKLEV